MQSYYVQDGERKHRRVLERIGDYSIGKTIGRGNFAVVRVAKHGIANMKVALKIVDKSRVLADDMSKIEREISILKSLDHPHIVKLYEIINTNQYLYAVMEYASNGELFELLMEKGRVTENEARRLFQQISAAVAYCHARGVVHRDLKAENLLLDANNDIKLIDFGFSNIQKPESLLTTFCGSPPYAAPELLLGKAYDGMKADVWSLGVVLYVLVTGGFPFPGEINKLKFAILAEQLKIPYWVSFSCADLIRKMLVFHPARRMSIANVIQHRWLHENSSDTVQRLILESTSGRLHVEESPGRLNPTVLLFMQQRTKWSEEQIVEEVTKRKFDSPIYGTYQLLCCKVRESYANDKSSSQPRRGSRGSITSGKANVEVEAPTIPAHQFARLSLSAVDNSESDKSDASDPDEATTSSNWTRRHKAQLGLVTGGEYSQASLSSRTEARRHSLCAENLLPLKSLLLKQQLPSNTPIASAVAAAAEAVAAAAVACAENTVANPFAHSALPYDFLNVNNGPLYAYNQILPLPSLERRASAGEAVLSASGYLQLGSSYAMNNLVTSHRNSLTNSRLRASIPNSLTAEEEGKKYLHHCGSFKRNTVDCLLGIEDASGVPVSSPFHIRFAGCPYAKQSSTERRRSWTPIDQGSLINSEQQSQLEQLYKQSVTSASEQIYGVKQLQKEFQKLKASTEPQPSKVGRQSISQNVTGGTKCTPRISIIDENNCCLRFSTPSSLDALYACDKELGAEAPLRRTSNPCHAVSFDIDHTAVSLICPYNADETLRRLRIAFDKFDLGYEQNRCGSFPSPLNETHGISISSNGTLLMQVNVAVTSPFCQPNTKVEFVYSATDAEKCERLCADICREFQVDC